MTGKPIARRISARRDAEAATDYYWREAGSDAALGFVEAIEAAIRRIAENPGIGSPRYAHKLDLAGLRCLRLQRYPYLIFYVERADRIDIWRVLHAKRDLPSWLVTGS